MEVARGPELHLKAQKVAQPLALGAVGGLSVANGAGQYACARTGVHLQRFQEAAGDGPAALQEADAQRAKRQREQGFEAGAHVGKERYTQ